MSKNYKAESGCYIDGNVMNADEFNLDVIYYATSEGMKLEEGEEAASWSFDEWKEKYGQDASQVLNDLSEEAVDFLNTLDEYSHGSWFIEESCLMFLDDSDKEEE